MSGYIGPAPVPQSTQTRQTFTATSGQTSFATVGYVAGGQFIQVYLNGVLLKLTDDYTAENGSDILLTSGAATGDILEFISFADFTVNNQNFTGGLTVDNDGSTVLTVDRATSDGTIIDVQKSGSSVGSIGVYESDRLYIADQSNGLQFDQTIFRPCNNTGANTDDVVTLGSGGSRFKDLYLSGGVFLGGTGSSNKLDDYEEGTWSPKITGNSGAFSQTYSQQSGRYTRVGNFVYMTYDVHLSDAGSPQGTYMVLGNLPFTPMTGNYGGSFNVTYYSGWQNLSTSHIAGYINGSNAYLTNGANDYIRIADGNHSATSRLIGSGWFMVA